MLRPIAPAEPRPKLQGSGQLRGARSDPAARRHFHPDGTVRGLVNVFLPLVRVCAFNGPTELRRGSHEQRESAPGFAGRALALLLRPPRFSWLPQRNQGVAARQFTFGPAAA